MHIQNEPENAMPAQIVAVMKTINVSDATPLQIDWLVWAAATNTGQEEEDFDFGEGFLEVRKSDNLPVLSRADSDGGDLPFCPSTNWSHGGPIIQRVNITIIRADDDYGIDDKGFTTNERIPQWFAQCDRWTGHSLTTSYEGENMEPTFMIGAEGGYFGTTPLQAAMRAYVALQLGSRVEVPECL